MKNFLRQSLFLISAVFILFTAPAKAEEFEKNAIEAQYYFLIDADSGEVLLSKNADERIPPSSMTKLMTAYVVFDQIKKGRLSFDNQCLIGKDAWRKSGSSMFLNYGDVVSIDELIRGLLAVSGNDAAIALAESTAGGINNFVGLMNSEARELGMNNSHFQNPHGLHEAAHYMSLRDLATLAAALCRNFPQYEHYLGITEFTYRRITQKSRNPLIKENYEGAIGGKTGHTNEGGYGVIGIVKRDSRRLIAVVNKAKTPKQRSTAIIELFDYGFSHYKKLVLFEKNQSVATVKTWLGDKVQVEAVTNRQISLSIPRDKMLSSVKVKVQYLSPLYTPIQKNAKIANLIIEVEGDRNFEYPLFAKEAVGKAGYFKRINQVLRYKLANFL